MRRWAAPAVLAMVLVAGTGACARSDERPTGVAEKWLQEVANQGRDGTRKEATERANALGDEALVAELLTATPEPDERYFSDLEVGKARVEGDRALVPYRLTARLEGDEKEERTGTLTLARMGSGWRVIDVAGPTPGLAVPSDGGDLPARAEATHWIAALLLGIVLTAVCVMVVEMQPRSRAGAPA